MDELFELLMPKVTDLWHFTGGAFSVIGVTRVVRDDANECGRTQTDVAFTLDVDDEAYIDLEGEESIRKDVIPGEYLYDNDRRRQFLCVVCIPLDVLHKVDVYLF